MYLSCTYSENQIKICVLLNRQVLIAKMCIYLCTLKNEITNNRILSIYNSIATFTGELWNIYNLTKLNSQTQNTQNIKNR